MPAKSLESFFRQKFEKFSIFCVSMSHPRPEPDLEPKSKKKNINATKFPRILFLSKNPRNLRFFTIGTLHPTRSYHCPNPGPRSILNQIKTKKRPKTISKPKKNRIQNHTAKKSYSKPKKHIGHFPVVPKTISTTNNHNLKRKNINGNRIQIVKKNIKNYFETPSS